VIFHFLLINVPLNNLKHAIVYNFLHVSGKILDEWQKNQVDTRPG